jgi:C1A family cysteine protease
LSAPGSTAPIGSAYVQYKQDEAAGKVVTHTVGGYPLGYEPPPLELSQPVPTTSLQAVVPAQTYPTRYDLRTLGKVSAVEDQYPCGTCWTFGAFGSLESYLLPTSTTQFSENHLRNYHDFTVKDCCKNDGGSFLKAGAYLARWGTTEMDANGKLIQAGPVERVCDPYLTPPYASIPCTSATTCPIVEHVQNVYTLPLKQSPTDNNVIKSALMTYGGIATSMYIDEHTAFSASKPSPYWNNDTSAYYWNGRLTSNHGVMIVGWDDNYPATNFATTPPGNGAYIVKNSWGMSFGQSGYFYVSYYDTAMGHVSLAVFTAEPTTNYNTNYQYDPFGVVTRYGYGTNVAYGANVFNATSDGTLKAISFWAPDFGTSYTASIYTNPTANNPASGTLASTISGAVGYAGYYTEPLNTTVPLTRGETFSVVIKFTTPGDPMPVTVQIKKAGYDDAAPPTPTGVSFVSRDGTTWTDLTTIDPSSACNIHAFAA